MKQITQEECFNQLIIENKRLQEENDTLKLILKACDLDKFEEFCSRKLKERDEVRYTKHDLITSIEMDAFNNITKGE